MQIDAMVKGKQITTLKFTNTNNKTYLSVLSDKPMLIALLSQ